jgi:hypothetical protein
MSSFRLLSRLLAPARDLRRPIWADRWSVMLAVLALGLNGALAFALWSRFETLPDLIAIHFNPYGEVDLIGSKSEIFKLPLIGVLIWAMNALVATLTSPHDRVLARLVLAVSVLAQVLFALAAWRILS